MSVPLKKMVHVFSIHGDEMSPDGRRKVAEAIESGEAFKIVLSDFSADTSLMRVVQLSDADWTALLGQRPLPNPILAKFLEAMPPERKHHPIVIVYPETEKAPKVN